MGLAVGGKHAPIQPGEQTELGQLLGQPLPLFFGLVAETRRAGGSFGGGARLGVVEATLAGVAAQPHDVAGERFSATHRFSLSGQGRHP